MGFSCKKKGKKYGLDILTYAKNILSKKSERLQ